MSRTGKSLMLVATIVLALTSGQAAGDEPLKVLFIGNSFTNTNSLPTIFGNLAMDAGWEPPIVVNASVVSQALEYHTTSATTLAQIDAGGWTHVILQEYSTRPTDSATDPMADPLQFKQDATFLYDRIKASSPDAQVILYETWAREETNSYYPTYSPDRDTMQAQLNYHYHDAAENYIPTHSTAAVTTDVTVTPAGEAWHLNYHGDNIWLYAADKYHPNTLGSYLSAMVIYSTIYGRSAAGRTPQLEISTADAAYLQWLADQTTGITAPGGPDGQKSYGVYMGSFEKPALATDSAFTNRQVSGWTQASFTTNGLGVRNSKDDLFAGTTQIGGVDRPLPAPADGYQFLWVNSGQVSQQLRDVLLPNTKYTLTVAVGRMLKASYIDTNFFIKLYAGDTEIQTLTGDTASIALGTFEDQVIYFMTGPSVTPDQPLRIHLGREGSQIASKLAFDNVRLNVWIGGDHTRDGIVNQADYTLWADTFGNDGSPGKEDLRADFNENGVVDIADYTIWADNFNVGYPPEALALPQSTTLNASQSVQPADADPAAQPVRIRSRREIIRTRRQALTERRQAARQRLATRRRQSQ